MLEHENQPKGMSEEQPKNVAKEQEQKIRERIEQGKISREISKENLLSGDPTKDRMYGRLEAFLQSGAVVDDVDLEEVVDQFGFTSDEVRNLTEASHIGLMEGLIQEPDNISHYGFRTGCFAKLSQKYFEMERKNPE